MKQVITSSILFFLGMFVAVLSHERDMFIHQYNKDRVLKPIFFEEVNCNIPVCDKMALGEELDIFFNVNVLKKGVDYCITEKNKR